MVLPRDRAPADEQPRDYDPPLPAGDVLSRYNARVLAPHLALQLPGQPELRDTAYVVDRLLVSTEVDVDATLQHLGRAADRLGYRLELEDAGERQGGVRKVRFETRGEDPALPPDAWSILQWARSLAGDRSDLPGVGLDHLLFASVGVLGVRYHQPRRRTSSPQDRQPAPPQVAAPIPPPAATPAAPAAPPAAPPAAMPATEPAPEREQVPEPTVPSLGEPDFDEQDADEELGGQGREETLIENYARQGTGGRQSVAWLGPAPYRRPDHELEGRRPVVAILDNGCGSHPWLDIVVQRGEEIDGRPIGLEDPLVDPEFSDLARDLPRDDFADAVAGHGTFMAGLVVMACPDADILAIRVVNPDGVVVESDLMAALVDLLELVRRHRYGEEGGRAIDVLVLSMGYYPEQYDAGYEPDLARVLDEFGRLGVVVVTAAGNDATTRPMYPAALAPHADGREVFPDRVPVICVGASNPADGTWALFSNFGPWVTTWEPGAGVVSTMPVTFQGGLQPVFRTPYGGRIRSAIDPDDYRSGFAVWSGTSFAAPTLAGRLCQALLGRPELNLDDPAVPAAVSRALEAVGDCTGLGRK